MKYDPKIYSTSNLYKPTVEALEPYFERIHNDSIVKLFEERFSEYHQAKHCVSFSTGFWALVSAILIKVEGQPVRGDVLMPSMTYRRLADVVNWTGLTPKFVDIGASSLAMCPEALASNIDANSSLVLPVHPIVNCCDVEKLKEIAASANLPILFDAVESVHETHKGKRIGSFGVGEVFSLHASKLINGVEGGYVCSDDDDFVVKLRSIQTRNSQQRPRYIQADIHPVHCAYALAGLDGLDKNVSHNQEVYRSYQEALADHPLLTLKSFDEKEQTSFKNIVVELNSQMCGRDDVVKALNEIGIAARAHYSPALHEKKTSYRTIIPPLPNSEIAKSRYINLPCGQRFEPSLAKKVVQEINLILGI